MSIFARLLVSILILVTMPLTMPLYGMIVLIQKILKKRLEKYTVAFTIRNVPIIYIGGITGIMASIFLFNGSPAVAVRGILSNVVVILRPINFGMLYHELAHVLYDPAAPFLFIGLDPLGTMRAHFGKGHRSERQADKWAVTELIKENRIEYVREYINALNKAWFDGKYRARMLTRYVRRYYGIGGA